MSFVTAILAEAPQTLVEIPFPPIVYGLIAITTFAVLGFVLWSYRSVANRHAPAASPRTAQTEPLTETAQIKR